MYKAPNLDEKSMYDIVYVYVYVVHIRKQVLEFL